MCLPVSIKKTSKNSFFIPSSALENPETLENKIPDKLYRLIKDWKEKKSEFEFKTSGSTGQPKNIILLREQILASAKRSIKIFELNNSITALIALNLDYIAGFMMLIRALEAKMNIHYFEPTSDPFESLLSNQSYFLALVPIQVKKLLDKKYHPDNIHCMIIGGTSIDKDLEDKLVQLNYKIYETYGMTETVSHIAIKSIKSDKKTKGFKVLEGINIRVSNDKCLEIKGDITRSEWIKTNDIVQILNDNEFIFLGRKDDIINSGGIKILPQEIEENIKKNSKYIFENINLCVSSIQDSKFGEKLVLVIESEEEFPIDNLETLYRGIDKLKRPKELLFVPKIPRTESGKINRKMLKETLRDFFLD